MKNHSFASICYSLLLYLPMEFLIPSSLFQLQLGVHHFHHWHLLTVVEHFDVVLLVHSVFQTLYHRQCLSYDSEIGLPCIHKLLLFRYSQKKFTLRFCGLRGVSGVLAPDRLFGLGASLFSSIGGAFGVSWNFKFDSSGIHWSIWWRLLKISST